MTSSLKFRLVVTLLIAIHAVIFFGGFFAPNDAAAQNRDFPYAAPTRLHFIHPVSGWSWRPFVYGLKEVPGNTDAYQEDKTQKYPLQFFVRGDSYSIAGVFSSHRHLFGVRGPARVFLLGTDGLGRDQFSRLLVGGQISLLAGILATLLSLLVGLSWGQRQGSLASGQMNLSCALPICFSLFRGSIYYLQFVPFCHCRSRRSVRFC